MSQVKPKHSRRFGVEFEEEKAWVGFYRNVGNPAIAVEVMNQLESDPSMKRMHLALYLRCKESLRAQKAVQARNVSGFVKARKFGFCARFSAPCMLLCSASKNTFFLCKSQSEFLMLAAGRSGGAPEHTQGYALTGDLASARLKSPLPALAGW